ncbi:MAG: class I SAM-dependent methyltransferase [Planctomycetota bacterium]|jgi:2-polyprenyl-6-hydroxyphenyl methylase/3-demethylubiquinone-9 3-methyltransferase
MKTYSIKEGYEHRTANVTVETEPGDYFTPTRIKNGRYLQVHPYLEAARLMRREGLGSVLDVGCGTGCKLVAHLEPVARTSVGLDQQTVIDLVQKLHPESKSSFVVADLERPAETDLGTFDLIVSIDVVEHLLDPDLLLDFIRAHCHDGSWVALSTPERDVRRGPDNMKSPRKEHVREWNQGELRQYLESRGFEVVRQVLLPAFRVGFSPRLLRERLRLVRKRIPYRYNQLAVCRPGALA